MPMINKLVKFARKTFQPWDAPHLWFILVWDRYIAEQIKSRGKTSDQVDFKSQIIRLSDQQDGVVEKSWQS